MPTSSAIAPEPVFESSSNEAVRVGRVSSSSQTRFDAVLIGSGINSLACAALLARDGWSVCVLERNDWFGGAVKTAELTVPGFHHDVFSAWHPLWVGGQAHALLGDDLASRGLEYLNTELPTASTSDEGEVGLPASLRRRQSRGVRAARRRRRRCLAGVPRRIRAERRPGLRDARDGALVACRRRSLREGAAKARPARASRVRRERPRLGPRLAHGRLRVGCRPRPARPVGAPHGPRPGLGDIRLHGAGDRVRRAGGRDAGSPGWRGKASRGARPVDSRPRRRVPAARPRSPRSPSSQAVRPACGRPRASW